MQNNQLAKFGHAQKAKYRDFRSDTAVLNFSCRFFSSILSLFLPLFFFFSWAFSRLHFGLKSFWKKLFNRILGLEKGRWVVKQDFHGNFRVNVTCSFTFFSVLLDWIVLIVVWMKGSVCPAPDSGQSYPWPLKLMTSQVVEGGVGPHGGYGRFRGEWV